MDIVLRALVIYAILLLIFRMTGKRSMSQVTTFDFVLLLIIGEATQQALLGEEVEGGDVGAAVRGGGAEAHGAEEAREEGDVVLLQLVLCAEFALPRERLDHVEAEDVGLPLLPHTLAGWLLNVSDRWLLGLLLGLSVTETLGAIGVYSLGYQLGYAVGLAAISFNAAWLPVLYRLAETMETRAGAFAAAITIADPPSAVPASIVIAGRA